MVIYSGSDDVALVFDDGPNPKLTPKFLEVLRNRRVKASFFLIGKRVEESPELAKQIAEEGHEIGNHTYTHKRLAEMLNNKGQEAVLEEIEKGAAAIESATSVRPLFLRAPYLDWSEGVGKIAEPLYGDNVILTSTKSVDCSWGDHVWNEDDISTIHDKAAMITSDWADNPKGTIIALHDSAEYNLPGNSIYSGWQNRALPTLEALPIIIDNYLSRGMTFKKLSEMDLITEQLKA